MCGHPRRPVMVRRHARMAVLGIAVDLPSPRACASCMGSDPYRRAARRLRAPAGLGCAQTDGVFGCLPTADAVTSQRLQKWQDRGVSEWVFFMHPPRDGFIATMSGTERAAFGAHAAWLRRLLADGLLIVAGPCLGQVNTGIAIFEVASEGEAQRIVVGEPVTSGGYMGGGLRPFRLGILRGRDGAARDRPAQPVSSQPAHCPGTVPPPLLALGQDRPMSPELPSSPPVRCSSDASRSALRRASGTGRCCARTVTPSWSASAATCRTGACCTPIPACRCRWAQRSPSATTRRCTGAPWRIWS